jgi:hypothetical protein
LEGGSVLLQFSTITLLLLLLLLDCAVCVPARSAGHVMAKGGRGGPHRMRKSSRAIKPIGTLQKAAILLFNRWNEEC